MFALKRLNVVKMVKTEKEKDNLVRVGFKEIVQKPVVPVKPVKTVVAVKPAKSVKPVKNNTRSGK